MSEEKATVEANPIEKNETQKPSFKNKQKNLFVVEKERKVEEEEMRKSFKRRF